MFPVTGKPLEVYQSFHIADLHGYTSNYLVPTTSQPSYYPELLERFDKYFTAMFTTNSCETLAQHAAARQLQRGATCIEASADRDSEDDDDEDSDGEKEVDKERSDGVDRLSCLQARIEKRNDYRMKPNRNVENQIFANFPGFRSESAENNTLYSSREIFAADISRLNGRLKPSRITHHYSFNISGGIVVSNQVSAFRGLYLNGEDEITGVNTGDFNSLYPRSMQFANICQSTAGYASHFAMRVGDNFYNPFDPRYFIQVAAPIKINEHFLAVAVFLIRGDCQVSVFGRLIDRVMTDRNNAKKQMEAAKKQRDFVKAQFFNILQENLKRFVNTMYGTMLSYAYASFRPYLASLITYFGRLALLRFFFTVNYYMYQQGRDQTYRILGGDTDSLFIRCRSSDMTNIIKMFGSWPANRGIYAIAHEKSGTSALFLGRKQYIIHIPAENDYVCKAIFKKNQNVPSKKLFEKILQALFGVFFDSRRVDPSSAETLVDFGARLRAACREYAQAPDEAFVRKLRLGQDLADFKSLSRLHKQLRELSKRDPARQYLRGTEVLYYHYQYVFDQGKFYGPIKRTNHSQLAYVEKNPECTSLTQDLYELEYAEKFRQQNIQISKIRSFEIDFRAILEKIVACFNMPLAHMPEHIARHGLSFRQTLFDQINDIFDAETGHIVLVDKKTPDGLEKGQTLLPFKTSGGQPLKRPSAAAEREKKKQKQLDQFLNPSIVEAFNKVLKYSK